MFLFLLLLLARRTPPSSLPRCLAALSSAAAPTLLLAKSAYVKFPQQSWPNTATFDYSQSEVSPGAPLPTIL
ncbi:hypothetical protein BU25DRAFT_409522, partial [Macroventuria anomochaeta]